MSTGGTARFASSSSWSERLLDDELLAAFHDFSVFAGPVRGICLLRSACNGLPMQCRDWSTGHSCWRRPRPTGVRYTALETVRSYGASGCGRRARTTRHSGGAEWFTSAVTELGALVRTAESGRADPLQRHLR